MSKALTPEQLQKKEERRARFKLLVQKVAAMSDQEREALSQQLLGLRTVEGHALSGQNCGLIWLQLPTATLLGGFRQWLDHGRCVRKGEHGLMIWIPAWKKGDEAAANAAEPDEKYFVMGTVFDVSQTVSLTADESAPFPTLQGGAA